MRYLILVFLYIPQVFATYNESCMKLLVRPRPPLVERYHQQMMRSVDQLLPASLNSARLTPVDYEVVYDTYHDLPLIAVFTNGERLKLGADRASLDKLLDKLHTVNVLQVLYLPQALDKIRFVLREACFQLGEPHCDSYDTYMGLMDNRARIFSRREEQLIKWATIYQMPTHITAKLIKQRGGTPAEQMVTLDQMRAERQKASEELLHAVFNSQMATRIYESFAKSYITDGFERLKNMVTGNVVVLSR